MDNLVVHDPPRLDRTLAVRDEFYDHRVEATFASVRRTFSDVVRGRDVIEIGCGVLGGLADMALTFACRSYTGIDRIVSHDAQIEGTMSRWENKYCNSGSMVRIEPNIPPELLENERVAYHFGIDAYSFLQSVPENSAVTISTGVFHDYLIDPQGKGQAYLEKLAYEMARVTIPGNCVGLHQIWMDLGMRRRWNLPRRLWKRHGLGSRPHEGNDSKMWVLSKA